MSILLFSFLSPLFSEEGKKERRIKNEKTEEYFLIPYHLGLFPYP